MRDPAVLQAFINTQKIFLLTLQVNVFGSNFSGKRLHNALIRTSRRLPNKPPQVIKLT